jgi:tetratricopeptide (TPR) repeat protein
MIVLERLNSLKMKNLALIEAYIDGDLSPLEQLELEQSLVKDRSLASELRLVQDINLALEEDEILDLRLTLAGIAATETASALRRRRIIPEFRPWGIRVAASVAILLASSLWYFYGFRQAPEDLYADYFEPYPSLYAVRSANQPIETAEIVRAMEPYVKGDFIQAQANLELLLKRDAGRIDLMFYLGICEMKLNETGKAVSTFEFVIHSGNQVFINHAQWYRALALLADGRIAQAKDAFRQIVKMDNSFSKDARRILMRLP